MDEELAVIAEKPPLCVKPKPSSQSCLITIRNTEDKWHKNHPINKTIKLINKFIAEVFPKQSVTVHKKEKSSMAPMNKRKETETYHKTVQAP